MICKIWGVKAHVSKGVNLSNIKKGLQNTLDYVDDDEKIHGTEESINPFTGEVLYSVDDLEDEINYINTSKNFKRVINYMADQHKTKNTYVSGYLCDPEHAIEQFMETKIQNLARVNKTLEDDLGNQGFHIVQSFPDDLDISDDEVHQCGIELCKKLGKFQAVITSHLHPVYDENGVLRGNCKHNHIIINSHMNPEFIDPEHPGVMKYHDCKETYAQLRMYNDEIAIEHGLPIIMENDSQKQYSWFANEMENQGKSWKKRMQYDIEDAMNKCSSWSEYKSYLMKFGYQIKEGKYETYTSPDGAHKARGATLGREYTKDYLMSFWELKKEMNQMLESYSENKESYVTDEQILSLLQSDSAGYHIRLPRMNKKDHTKYKIKVPVKFGVSPSVSDAYLKDDLSYPLYSKTGDYLGKIHGDVLKKIISCKNEEQYKEQKQWEEEETKRLQEQDISRVLNENKDSYSVPGWNNSKTNLPYRISMYDELGRKRSLIEHVLILAMIVINQEVPDFVLPEAQRKNIEKNNAKLAIIIAKPSWKNKKIMEALMIAREENISNMEELNAAIDNVGKNYSKTKAAERKNDTVKQKMYPIKEALNTVQLLQKTCEEIFAMPDGPEKLKKLQEHDGDITNYKYAKSLLFHNKLDTEEKIKDFNSRWTFNQEQEVRLKQQTEQYAEQYRRLKKLKYQLDLALSKEYCYGTSDELDKYKEKTVKPREQEKQKENEQQKKDI